MRALLATAAAACKARGMITMQSGQALHAVYLNVLFLLEQGEDQQMKFDY